MSVRSIPVLLTVALLSGCVAMPESQKVHVISVFKSVPASCTDLGPVSLNTGAALANAADATVSNPNDEMLRMQVLAKGGDTMQYKAGFVASQAEAYKCGK